MKEVLLAGAGGFLGAGARYLAGQFCLTSLPGAVFPWATFAVNVIGCFFIGLITGVDQQLQLLSPSVRVLLITGILGGFTTFSAFGLEVVSLLKAQRGGIAALYVFGSISLGGLAVWVGLLLGGLQRAS